MKNLRVVYHTAQGDVVDQSHFITYESKEELYDDIMKFFKINKEVCSEPVIYYEENFNLKSIPQDIITGIEILEVN